MAAHRFLPYAITIRLCGRASWQSRLGAPNPGGFSRAFGGKRRWTPVLLNPQAQEPHANAEFVFQQACAAEQHANVQVYLGWDSDAQRDAPSLQTSFDTA